jgi:arylsulfatase
VLRPDGRSLAALLAGEFAARNGPHEWIGFELGGERALRRGPWKLIWLSPPFGPSDWLLYHIDRDPAELYDRSQQDPDERRELLALWEDYARAHGVDIGPPDADGAAAAQKSSPMAR